MLNESLMRSVKRWQPDHLDEEKSLNQADGLRSVQPERLPAQRLFSCVFQFLGTVVPSTTACNHAGHNGRICTLIPDSALRDLLDRVHAVTDVHLDKHLVYTSGTHGHGYVNYRGLQDHPALVCEVACMLVSKMLDSGRVATGGTINLLGPETLGAEMVNAIKYELYPRTGSLTNHRGEVPQPSRWALERSTRTTPRPTLFLFGKKILSHPSKTK